MRNSHSQQQRGQGNKRQQQGQGGHQMQGRRPPQNRDQNAWNPENRHAGQQNQMGWGSPGSGWGEDEPRGFGRGDEREGGPYEQQWSGQDEGFDGNDSGRSQHDFSQQRGYGQQGSGQGGYGPQQGYGMGGYGPQQQGFNRGGAGFAGGGGDYYGQGQSGQGGSGGSPGQVGMGMGYRGEQQQQRFGKGPKGYKRSDERIKEDASDRISQMGHVDASDVEIEVKAGEVTLTGSVPSRTMKWQLENLVESVGGVTDVNNQLRIKREEMSGSKAPDEDKSSKRSTSTGSSPGMFGSSQGQPK